MNCNLGSFGIRVRSALRRCREIGKALPLPESFSKIMRHNSGVIDETDRGKSETYERIPLQNLSATSEDLCSASFSASTPVKYIYMQRLRSAPLSVGIWACGHVGHGTCGPGGPHGYLGGFRDTIHMRSTYHFLNRRANMTVIFSI
jgi:hypothetical protein